MKERYQWHRHYLPDGELVWELHDHDTNPHTIVGKVRYGQHPYMIGWCWIGEVGEKDECFLYISHAKEWVRKQQPAGATSKA